MTLLVILGIVVLGIGCLLADWRPDDHDEMAPWRSFKSGGERRTGSRTVTAAEPEPSHANRPGRLAGHRVPNAERDRQRGQEHGKLDEAVFTAGDSGEGCGCKGRLCKGKDKNALKEDI